MDITRQYFDGCPNWTITAERLDALAGELPGLTVTQQLIETPAEAEAAKFRGSPSVLLDGADLFPDSSAPVGLARRIYSTLAGPGGSPTLEQLRAALNRTAA